MTKLLNTYAMRGEKLDEELAELEAIKAGKKTNGSDEGAEHQDEEPKKGWEKRYSDLRSFSQKKENELKKELETLKGQLADAVQKQLKYPKTEEEVEAWMKKFPDVGAIVRTIALKEVANLRGELDEREAVVSQRAYQVEFDRCFNMIMKAHPDFVELRDDDEFAEWLAKQPKATRNAFETDPEYDDLEDVAETVIAALEMFKFKTKKPEPKKDDRREAAKSVTRSNASAPRAERDPNFIYESDVDKMNVREYEKHEAEILQAMREGRMVYDLSGAAR